MKLPMDPSVYMCYIMYSKYNFKELACKWNKEFKAFDDDVAFRTVKEDIKHFRKKHWNTPRARGWGNFDTRHLMNFINKYLDWG